MRIFIAGGTGVLGRRIVARLLDLGHDATVLVRGSGRSNPWAGSAATIVEGDVLDRDSLHTAIADSAPEAVMHQVTDLADRSPEANARVRIAGTRNLADAAAAAGVRILVAQSIAWCYEPGDAPAGETTPLDTTTTDPARALTVEAVAALERCAADIPHHVILRNGLLYGPETWYRTDGDVGVAAHAVQLPVTPDVASFVHVDDAASAAVLALGWPTGAVNIVDDEPASGVLWVPAFCSAVGAGPPVPSRPPRRPWARGASNLRARALGWSPSWPSWRQGFAAGLGG